MTAETAAMKRRELARPHVAEPAEPTCLHLLVVGDRCLMCDTPLRTLRLV